MVDGFERGGQRYRQGQDVYRAAQGVTRPPAFGSGTPPGSVVAAGGGREDKRRRLLESWTAVQSAVAAVRLLGRELAVEAERGIVAADQVFQQASAAPADAVTLLGSASATLGSSFGDWYGSLGVLAVPGWDTGGFSAAAVVDDCGPVRVGNVLVPSGDRYRRAGPALCRFPWESLTVVGDDPGGGDAAGVVSAVLCRVLAAAPAGRIRLHVLDPQHAGRSASVFMGLGDLHRPSLTVRTSGRDIDEHVQWLARETAERTERNLGSVYRDVQAYNRAVPDSPLPFQVVFAANLNVRDYGTETARLLVRLAGSGPAAGTVVVTTTDPVSAETLGFTGPGRGGVVFLPGEGRRVGRWMLPASGDRTAVVPVELDDVPPPDLCAAVTDRYGRRTASGAGAAIPVSRVLPPSDTWFRGDSTEKASIPVGVHGTTVVPVEIGDTAVDAPAHGIIVGATGSGKTTLFHTMLHAAAAVYPADELEFWIVDMKEGVEFAAYAPGGDTPTLPNLGVVAMEADREFSLAVLNQLNALIAERAAMFKACDPPVKDIIAYRHQTGQKMPRVVAIIDEFQRCFTQDLDRVTQDAWIACENITKQGRSHGVHLVFASQSLRGLASPSPSQRESVFAQMLLRVSLKSALFDAQLVLGEKNPAVGTLERRGDAVINPAGGDPTANRRATVAYLDTDGFRSLRREIAAAAPVTLDPFVFRGDMQTPVTTNPGFVTQAVSGVPAGRTWDVWFGQPLAIASTVTTPMWAEPKRNLVVVGGGIGARDAAAVVSNTVLSFAAHHPPGSAAYIIVNLLSAVSDLIDHPDQVAAALGSDASLVTNQTFKQAVERVAADIAARSVARPTLVAVYGGHRSDLRTADYGKQDELADAFSQVLSDGPAQHVTTVAWWEDRASLLRAVGKTGIEQFGVRVAVNLPKDEAAALLEQTRLAPIGDRRAVLWDREDRTRVTRFIPHGLPDVGVLEQVQAMRR